MAKKSKKKKKYSPSAKSKANKGYKAKGKKKSKSNGISLATVKAMFAKKKGGKKKYKRNPGGLGLASRDTVANSAAVLGGVTIAKLVPPLFPASWTATDLGRFLTTLGVAVGETVAAHFFLPKYRNMVMYGGGSMALSAALNPVLRKLAVNVTVGRARQANLRDFVSANFPEPHNPIYNRMVAAGMNTMPGATGAVGSMTKYAGRWH